MPFSSLYWKISAVFLLLILCLGLSFALLVQLFWQNLSHESLQRINWDLAASLRPRFVSLLEASPNERFRRLEYALQELRALRPDVDVYILDGEGEILHSAADFPGAARFSGYLLTTKVETAPLERFLSEEEPPLPLLGDDPLRESRSPFSVSRLNLPQGGQGESTGYLYVILGGRQAGFINEVLTDSYAARGGIIAFVMLLMVTAAVGLGAFHFLTRRLRHLFECMSRFAAGDAQARAELHQSDEIGQVAEAFNHMADTIGTQVKSLERADNLRRNLVANLSHDLRRPLTSIVGYMDRIELESRTPPDIHGSLEVVKRNVLVIKRMADELFDLSRLEAKERQPQFEIFSISDLVNDILLHFAPAAAAKSLSVLHQEATAVPLVRGDPRMIELVLGNLIDNAIRHTPAGGTITVALTADTGRVAIEVRDTGVGIPESELPFIFERFYQARTAADHGTGLGLAIAQRIVKLHGSDINVESKAGQGATFCFSLQAVENRADASDQL